MPPEIYQPTSLGLSILALVFYIFMAGFIIYSLIALYSLLRYGRSVIVAVVVALLYLIISASLYAAAVGNLNSIRF